MSLETMEPSHNTGQIPFQIWGQYHQKIAFCIAFSNLCFGSFPKMTFGDSIRTCENEILWFLWSVKYCNCCLLNYTTLFILKTYASINSRQPVKIQNMIKTCRYELCLSATSNQQAATIRWEARQLTLYLPASNYAWSFYNMATIN